MEIVYFPYDKSRPLYDEFRKVMPWLCMPYNDSKVKSIQHKFNIISIPHLLVLKPDATIAIENARADV